MVDWLKINGADHCDVIVFDDIEAINYVIFRNMRPSKARIIAHKRGNDLNRMFNSVFANTSSDYVCSKESESEIKKSQKYSQLRRRLYQAYEKNPQFREDVELQVIDNLKQRIDRYGSGYILDNIHELGQYVLDEIAFFEAYYSRYPNYVEIYPGKILFVKKALWEGKYPSLKDLARREKPRYVEISHLRYCSHTDLPKKDREEYSYSQI